MTATQKEAQAKPLIKLSGLYFFGGIPADAQTIGIVILIPAAKRESNTAIVPCRRTNLLTLGYHLLNRFDFWITRAAR